MAGLEAWAQVLASSVTILFAVYRVTRLMDFWRRELHEDMVADARVVDAIALHVGISREQLTRLRRGARNEH
jgi:hypothetical protein